MRREWRLEAAMGEQRTARETSSEMRVQKQQRINREVHCGERAQGRTRSSPPIPLCMQLSLAQSSYLHHLQKSTLPTQSLASSQSPGKPPSPRDCNLTSITGVNVSDFPDEHLNLDKCPDQKKCQRARTLCTALNPSNDGLCIRVCSYCNYLSSFIPLKPHPADPDFAERVIPKKAIPGARDLVMSFLIEHSWRRRNEGYDYISLNGAWVV